MYESPITLLRLQTDNLIKEVNEKTDEVIFKAVVKVLPQVNKEELIKALQYDRQQYEKGYADGIGARPTGEWIPHILAKGQKSIDNDVCSECGERYADAWEFNFCPNCGARMKGGEDE